MSSPIPGMDLYLEGYLWPDVHQRLAAVISELLAPQISPKYVVRLIPHYSSPIYLPIAGVSGAFFSW